MHEPEPQAPLTPKVVSACTLTTTLFQPERITPGAVFHCFSLSLVGMFVRFVSEQRLNHRRLLITRKEAHQCAQSAWVPCVPACVRVFGEGSVHAEARVCVIRVTHMLSYTLTQASTHT